MKPLTFAVAAVAALVTTGAAVAQSAEYNRQLDVQLREARQLYLPAGQRLVRGPLGGSLEQGGSINYTFQFTRGVRYTVLGVCDNDCTDLDMVMTDPQGRQVAEDVLTDDKPVNSVTAAVSGRYRVRVSMASCSTEPCFFAIAAYGSQGGPNSARPR